MLPIHPLQVEFNRLYREMRELYHETAMAVNLTDSGLTVMYAICELGEGCQQKDICQLCDAPKQTVHSALRKLMAEGFVRTESGRGHDIHLYLTPEGMALADRIILLVSSLKPRASYFLPLDEREESVREIRHYVSALKKELRGE